MDKKWFAFHYNNGRNARYIASGRNQSEAVGKLAGYQREQVAMNGTCVSECKSLREAQIVTPRIA